MVYAFSLRETDISQIKKLAQKHSLKVVAIGYNQTWADYNIINLGPFEWLGYFDKAEFVLTSTFHGTLYSLKYKKNFITSNNGAISNKIKTILFKLGLLDRLTEGSLNFNELYAQGVDYASVNKLLAPLIKNSKNFLIKAIEND